MSNDTPFMRWHVDAYLGDTGHLTCLEHGAYTQILWACWKRGGSIPERHLQRLVGMSAEDWAESRDTLAEFFVVDDGAWSHNKVIEEIDHVEGRRAAARKAGAASSKARKQRTTNGRSTPVEQSSNERSTDAERTLNHEDVEEDREEDSSLPSVENDITSRAREVVPERPSQYLDHLRNVHGYGSRCSPMNNQMLQQATRWQNEHVTLAEIDHAVIVSRESLAAEGEQTPALKYLAKVIASGRKKSGSVGVGSKAATNHTGFAERDYLDVPDGWNVAGGRS